MVHESLLSFVPGGRDNAVFVQKRAFETLASPAEDDSYYLHPSVIAACFRVNPGAIAAESEREILNQEAQGDEDQVQALYKRMREAATWEAPALVQETLVDQIQDFASILPAIRLTTAAASKSESSPQGSVEIELSEVGAAEDKKASEMANRMHGLSISDDVRFSQAFEGERITEMLDLESQAGAGNGEDPVNVLNPLQAKHVQNPLRLETPPQMVNSTVQSASASKDSGMSAMKRRASFFAETTAPSTNRDRTVRRSSIQPGIRQTSPTRGPASNVDP